MKYDVKYGPQTVLDVYSIDPHFCRSWDEDGGCYGTNEEHGLTFVEAKQLIIDDLKMWIKHFEELNEE